jgi:FtsP/CotA-like multicopper oxidase with cupredoxin domain
MSMSTSGNRMSRRDFLSRTLPTGAALAAGSALPTLGPGSARAQAPAPSEGPTVLRIVEKDITIGGRTAKALRIEQPDGTWGFAAERGQPFHVVVQNQIGEPTCLHWHGLVLPNDQDGVPFVTQAPIPPGGEHEYRFPLVHAGTYWMHSYDQRQRQRGLGAPLIVREPGEAGRDETEVVMFLADWTFGDPMALWTGLRKRLMPDGGFDRLRLVGGVEPGPTTAGGKGPSPQRPAAGSGGADYDAFLANGRTLSDPEVVRVPPGKTVRLRAINGATGSNFFLMLGSLTGQAVAVDGHPIVPLASAEFELGMGSRIDVRVTLPAGEGAYPIFAQGEGTNRRSGLILATPRAMIPKPFSTQHGWPVEAGPIKIDEVGFGQELRLRSAAQLARRPIDRRLTVDLEGSMADYVWRLNGQVWPNTPPLPVKQGERVEIQFRNKSGMDHSMHLHGHVFHVTEVGQNPVAGAMRDTLLVNAKQSARIQFDADNPGVWLLQGTVMYHERNGMATTLNYEGVPIPDFGPRQ